jgi:uncharacterized HhH-GPD family protein
MKARLSDIQPLEPFDFRWPDALEHFERGWEAVATLAGKHAAVRHGLGIRIAYGRPRVRSVTWVNGEVMVEGVEADDYERSRGLLSVLKAADRTMIRRPEDLPDGLRDFDIVDHATEIQAPYTRRGLAVKIVEDDLETWAAFAIARAALYQRLAPGLPRVRPARSAPPPSPIPTGVTVDKEAVVIALLAYGKKLHPTSAPGAAQLTSDSDANDLVNRDAFAFLLGVIFDQNIPYERAWRAPLELKRRLGHLDPDRILGEPEAVRRAVQQPPKLHRYVENVPAWVVRAAGKVISEYGGDATRIWADRPTARELQRRLDDFAGIGQKKAAMAVEILERDLGVEVREMGGSDIAYDIHVRRVFLRTGLAEYDSVEHMVAVARELHAERPGALDEPAWFVGQNWCHPSEPDCPSCVLGDSCSRLIDRTTGVR